MQTQTKPKIEYTGQTGTPKLAKIQWKNLPDGWRKALATQRGNFSTQNASIVENSSSCQKLATQEAPYSIQCQSTGFYQRKLQAYPRVLLTIDEVCDFTGYSRKTVLGWLHKGYFAAAKINGQYFIQKQGLVLFFGAAYTFFVIKSVSFLSRKCNVF